MTAPQHLQPPLLADVRELIDAARQRVAQAVNAELTQLYWQIGRRISTELLQGQRADYGKQVMYLKPNGNANLRDAYDRAGMWLLTDSEGLRVKDVTAGGPAEKAGLKVEDLILAIDGKKATEIPLPDLRIRLANDPVAPLEQAAMTPPIPLFGRPPR